MTLEDEIHQKYERAFIAILAQHYKQDEIDAAELNLRLQLRSEYSRRKNGYMNTNGSISQTENDIACIPEYF